MTMNTQTTTILHNESATFDEAQQYRAGAYALLASLLRSTPSDEVLTQAAALKDVPNHGDDLSVAMSMLGLAAQHSQSAALDDEYHALFIGLGRGELVPYGSWYLTGFLMEKPLGQLRHDLNLLGYQRDDSIKEPEDHIAALCEVMSMMIQEQRPTTVQMTFFKQHLAKWANRFFTDLTQAESAQFYQSVARFGTAFIDFENDYFEVEK